MKVVYKKKEKKTLHSRRRTGERGEKSKGRRVMEIGSEWASHAPGGHFRLSVFAK